MRRRTTVCGLAVYLLVLTFPLAVWGLSPSPWELGENPADFDGQMVTVSGVVTDLKDRVSRRGNPYFTFGLSDGRTAVSVFSFGTPTCPTGSKATVEGLFHRVKRLRQSVFLNQIDAARIRCGG